MTEYYRHTQPGHAIVVPLLGAIVLTLMVASAVVWHPVVWVTGLVFLGLLVLFHSLTVVVTGEHVICRFGPGLVKRRIPVTRILRAEPVRNSWWYGWGIRLTPHGWMFNVSGLDAVELQFKSGSRFRIGTDEPQALTEAINRVCGGQP